MSNINKGGPAFPAIKIVSGDNYNPPKQFHLPGMSLRDYFAAKAMQAQLITDGQPGEASDALIENAAANGQDPVYRLALNSYDVADAMLRAREAS